MNITVNEAPRQKDLRDIKLGEIGRIIAHGMAVNNAIVMGLGKQPVPGSVNEYVYLQTGRRGHVNSPDWKLELITSGTITIQL